MAITSQTWTRYNFEDNPVGIGNNYDSQEFIDHLVAFFTANTTQWTISDSGTGYVELKPPAGSINANDRILFVGNLNPAIGAMAHNGTRAASYVYACYAPNAGTTGPDQSVTVGAPYTGVTSSLLLNVGTNITSRNILQVFQSNDCICLWAGADGTSRLGSNVCYIGRAFNPAGTTDQFPLIATCASATTPTWSTTLESEAPNWTGDNSFGTTNLSIYVQESAGDVPWADVRRINGWDANQHRTGSVELDYYFNIHLGANRSAKNEFMGEVLFAKGGPSNFHGREIADSSQVYGYSQGANLDLDTGSTWYLWNE